MEASDHSGNVQPSNTGPLLDEMIITVSGWPAPQFPTSRPRISLRALLTLASDRPIPQLLDSEVTTLPTSRLLYRSRLKPSVTNDKVWL